MSGTTNKRLEKLGNKAYRDAYVRARVNIGIPHQIRALREQRGWSQAELGRRSGKPSNVINRLENPESGGNTIKTCLEMAAAFDVALFVKFVPYSRFLAEFEDVSPTGLQVPSFTSDFALSQQFANDTLSQSTVPIGNLFTVNERSERVVPIAAGLEPDGYPTNISKRGWFQQGTWSSEIPHPGDDRLFAGTTVTVRYVNGGIYGEANPEAENFRIIGAARAKEPIYSAATD